MCEIFISADPASYESRTRSVRLHGVVTSIRLEHLYWEVLEEIARRDGAIEPQLYTPPPLPETEPPAMSGPTSSPSRRVVELVEVHDEDVALPPR